ncbi:hypothetical protein F4819DRAFT_480743 [Hypoxylon fuscum]|nr:hypothetical protein F4819DRAFT_480743 [Hypoxylon fuscum]
MAPRTRSTTSASAHITANMDNQSDPPSSSSKAGKPKAATKGRKRKSTEVDSSAKPPRKRQAKKPAVSNEAEVVPDEERKPRLTTPDLQLDFDRSQLRDPRPTPGRVARPRMEGYDISEEFKRRFYIPKPKKPKGRLNAAQEEKLFIQEALLDPSATFHDMYVCHKKGRNGSPTYDSAGFRMDWKKVDDWMKPKAFSRSGAVNGMERTLKRQEKEERDMYNIFFVDGKGPEDESSCTVTGYVKDHISKDLGIPWHQIGPKEIRAWEKKGFPKQKAEEWWQEPNDVEMSRMTKMLSGASLRKDL